MILAFILTEDVIKAFFRILDDIPISLDIEDLLAYFQTTWIQGLSTASGKIPSVHVECL